MNCRKYNTDLKELLKQGKAIMTSSDESRFYFRVFAVNMVLSGFPASEIGSMAGVSKQAVTRWVKIADEQGFDALKPKAKPGRPSKLTMEQKEAIDTALQSDPSEHGFKVWDGPSLASYIKSTFGIDFSVRQCQRLFHELGYSHIRPQSYPSKGYEDTDARIEFKKNGKKSKLTSPRSLYTRMKSISKSRRRLLPDGSKKEVHPQ